MKNLIKLKIEKLIKDRLLENTKWRPKEQLPFHPATVAECEWRNQKVRRSFPILIGQSGRPVSDICPCPPAGIPAAPCRSEELPADTGSLNMILATSRFDRRMSTGNAQRENLKKIPKKILKIPNYRSKSWQ